MMSEKGKVSAIIPVYNSEKYIQKCLESLLNQTWDNIEIICIDDGSTDNGPDIIDESHKKDERIKLFRQPHKGVAAARNKGMEYASGEYLSFIDSDDWVEPNLYEKAIEQCKDTKADIVIYNFYDAMEDGRETARNNTKAIDRVFHQINFIHYMFERESYRSVTAWLWNKLFRRDLIQEYGIQFDETLRAGEDVLFMVNMLLHPVRATFCHMPLYHHVCRRDSLSRKYLWRVSCDRLRAYEDSIRLLEKKGVSEEIVVWLKVFYCFHAMNLMENAIRNGEDKGARQAICYINRYSREYMEKNGDKPERIERMKALQNGELL